MLSDPDRDLARELVFGVLRHRARLDAEIRRFCRFSLERLRRPLREILETALFQLRHLERIPPRAAVHEAVEMARGSAGEGASRVANGVLRSLLREPPLAFDGTDAAGLAVASSHPAFLVERWIARFGLERTRSILAADDERGRLHLLANALRAPRSALAEALAAEPVATRPIPFAENGLEVLSGNPFRTRAFADGDFYVADAGSQMLPALLPPGRTLLDLAAAPGGKSVAALVSGRFREVVSADRSLLRLDLLRQNRMRMNLAGMHPVAADILAAPWQPASFDRVLLDAPCSGTGTLRKNPEIRYRLTEAAISAMAGNALALLSAAGRLVAPGGYLLYSTCSLEAEENEDVAQRFLEAGGFASVPMEPVPEIAPFVSGTVFRIFPDGGADGFTAHLFRRSR